jgi:hypothetical protein
LTFFQLFWQIFKIFVLRLRTASASSGQASTERGLAAPPRLSGGARRLPSPARHLRSVGHRHREHNVHLHPRPPRESTIILPRRPPNPTSETNITILQFSTKFPHIRQPPNHKLYTNHHPWDPLVSPFIPATAFSPLPCFTPPRAPPRHRSLRSAARTPSGSSSTGAGKQALPGPAFPAADRAAATPAKLPLPAVDQVVAPPTPAGGWPRHLRPARPERSSPGCRAPARDRSRRGELPCIALWPVRVEADGLQRARRGLGAPLAPVVTAGRRAPAGKQKAAVMQHPSPPCYKPCYKRWRINDDK